MLGEWNVTFVCNFNDWEVQVVVSFFNLIYSHIPSGEGADGLRWRLKNCGIYIFLINK